MEDFLNGIKTFNEIQSKMFEGEWIKFSKLHEHIDEEELQKLGANYYEADNLYYKDSEPDYFDLLVKKTDKTKAKPSKFGKGTDTLFDEKVRNSLEIPIEELDQDLVKKIQDKIELNK